MNYFHHDKLLQGLVLYAAQEMPEFTIAMDMKGVTDDDPVNTYTCTSDSVFLFKIEPELQDEDTEFIFYFLSHQAIMRFLAYYNLLELDVDNVVRLFEAVYAKPYNDDYEELLWLQITEYTAQIANGLCITCHAFHENYEFIEG